MLRKRVVSLLTFYEGVLYRSKLFTPDYRYTANFVDAWSIDELIVLDITRPQNRDPQVFSAIINEFSKKCFVPMCVGGGVQNIDDFKRLLDLGADKVAVNSMAVKNPELISQAASKFGSQCVVVSIDARKHEKAYRVYTDCGQIATCWNPVDLAIYSQKHGAGELLITSIERDGSLQGYDNELNRSVTSSVTIPVIISGGAGKWQDFVDGFLLGGASAVATTNVYHFTETSIKSAKLYLKNQGINVRI